MSRLARLLRTVFSFPVFIAFALCALVAPTVRDRFDDPDLWWHLKMGQVIWTTRSIPTTEIFSHTAAGHLWIPHEWLSQLSIYFAYRLAGYSGLMLWLVVLSSLLLILVYALSCLVSGNVKVAFFGGLICWFFATVGLAIRPLLIGHSLLVVELILLQLGRTRDRRWFWGLPLVFAVWVNCHASYPFGLFILAVTIACGFFDLRVGPIVSSAWPPPARRTLIAASIASFAALFCNPMGWRLLTYSINVLLFQHSVLSEVQEWLPLSFDDARTSGLLLILGGTGWALAARMVEIRLEEMILVAAAAVFAVQHQRMLLLFGIVVAPVVCRLLAGFQAKYDSKRDLPVANGVCMVTALVVIGVSFPSPANLASQVRKANPVDAVEFIRRSNLPGPMLNEFRFGGYLIWALPEHKVFIDGRNDVFEWTGVMESFGRWALLEEDPQILLNRYHIQFCVLDNDAPMSHVLPYLPGWSKAYGDSLASVFVRQEVGPANILAPKVP